MIHLLTVAFIRMASSAQYPDLTVTDIYFGDEDGAEVLPVAGRKAYLWAIIENVGDGAAYNFYVDIQLGELVVRVGPYSLESYMDFPDKSVMRIHMPLKLSLEAGSYKARVNANPDQLLVGEGALVDSWWGNNELTKTINVTQTGASITIEKDKTLVNQPIMIKGTTEPLTPNVDITLEHRVEDSPWEELANVKTSNNG